MVATNSTMLALGTWAADFNLLDVRTQLNVSLSDHAGKPLLVAFICNHCPYVIHILETLVEVANDAVERGLAVVAISANDAEPYPQDGPEKMQDLAAKQGFQFPYLYDETQAVAKAYDAACTPDFFLFDTSHKLAYRGQLDGARPGNNVPSDGADLRNAINAVLSGQQPDQNQTPSIGCNIKWK